MKETIDPYNTKAFPIASGKKDEKSESPTTTTVSQQEQPRSKKRKERKNAAQMQSKEKKTKVETQVPIGINTIPTHPIPQPTTQFPFQPPPSKAGFVAPVNFSVGKKPKNLFFCTNREIFC